MKDIINGFIGILSLGLAVLFFLFVFLGGHLHIGSGNPFEINIRVSGIVQQVMEVQRNNEIIENFRRKNDRSN